MPDLASRVAGRDAQEVHAFLVGTPAEEVVALLSATPDEEVRALMQDEGVRHGAVSALVDRLHEFADPARLADLEGTVDFELLLGGARPEGYRLRFADGTVSTGDVDATAPDVVVRLSALRFLRMVTGQANAALLLLGGRLSVEGDAMLALAVGGVFRVPGQDTPAVDPTTLDPADVSRAVSNVRAEHLHEVMAGGFRPVVLAEIFRRMPEYVDPQKAAGLRCVIAFRIGGRPDGGHDRYLVRLADGSCRVTEDAAAGTPRDATLSLSGADFLRLATGHLNPVLGVLKGSLKVRGDRAAALAFSRALDLPVAS